jgi:hypothetical protein
MDALVGSTAIVAGRWEFTFGRGLESGFQVAPASVLMMTCVPLFVV